MLRAFLRQYEKYRIQLKEKKKDMDSFLEIMGNF